MFDLDKWKEIWATLRSNKLRTFLTAFGVFWGILMLMAMLGFASSLETGSRRQMKGLATNMLFVWGQATTESYDGLPTGREIQFTMDDIEPIRRLPAVDAVAPRIQLGGWQSGFTVAYESKSGSFQVYGDYPDLTRIIAFGYEAGRFINQRDILEQRKVAVIGNLVRDELYPPDVDPVGTYIKISGVYFQVVGVMKTLRTGREGERDALTVYVPFTTMRASFNMGNRVGFFALTAKPGFAGPAVETQVRSILKQRHRVSPTDELAIGSFNMFQVFEKIGGIFTAIALVGWVVGMLTLLAGVIGVSNIMLITVKERTKEIGVRKALGATPASIVAMVMKEAVVLTALAGLMGMAAGVGLLALAGVVLEHATNVPFGPPEVPLSTALVAVAVLVGAGGLAGIMPAAHAASIKPIEALRAE